MLFSFNLTGFIRLIKDRLFGRKIIISGSCRQCGACCRRLCLVIKNNWAKSIEEFNTLKKKNPEYERFRPIDKDDSGFLLFECTWLLPDNTCKDHKNRFELCKKFPETDIFFMNGVLPKTCGFKMNQAIPFQKELEKRISKSR